MQATISSAGKHCGGEPLSNCRDPELAVQLYINSLNIRNFRTSYKMIFNAQRSAQSLGSEYIASIKVRVAVKKKTELFGRNRELF